MPNAILILIRYLPEILKLLAEFDKRHKEAAREEKLSEDLKEIRLAFQHRDVDRINRMFANLNSRVPDSSKK